MFRDALDHYREEFAARDYLIIADVRCDDERLAVVIDADDLGDTPRDAADTFAEEVSEIRGAVVVGDWEGFRVDILHPSTAQM